MSGNVCPVPCAQLRDKPLRSVGGHCAVPSGGLGPATLRRKPSGDRSVLIGDRRAGFDETADRSEMGTCDDGTALCRRDRRCEKRMSGGGPGPRRLMVLVIRVAQLAHWQDRVVSQVKLIAESSFSNDHGSSDHGRQSSCSRPLMPGRARGAGGRLRLLRGRGQPDAIVSVPFRSAGRRRRRRRRRSDPGVERCRS